MLRLALYYGMSSAEVLNESIFIDGLINRLKRLERRLDLFKCLAQFKKDYQRQYLKDTI
jgi:acetyl-CoA carboxylase beta subunit